MGVGQGIEQFPILGQVMALKSKEHQTGRPSIEPKKRA
ncbi:hypothetical protein NC651_011468 [Populus alba x Populus x berolinensis]|nr:hypothetical protein NC651_011468 [Populus alba x Populus x berolinensis]